MNPIGALVVHAATLQEALQTIEEFRCLLGDDASFQIEEADGKLFIRARELLAASARVRRFLAEVVVAGLFRTIGRFRLQFGKYLDELKKVVEDLESEG